MVPDTVLMRELFKVEDPKAATVSSAVLHGILQSPASMFEYKVCHLCSCFHANTLSAVGH